jgi:hypothetical protein
MPIFTSENRSSDPLRQAMTKRFFAVLSAILLLVIVARANADWTVDFSRRALKPPEADLNRAASEGRSPASEPASDVSSTAASRRSITQTDTQTVTQENDREEDQAQGAKKKGVFDSFFDSGEPIQDIVILQTEHGFVPAIVRMRKNGRYRVSVVNVNEREKNVSFILDAFSEHHATYYGKIKSFTIEPKKEGSFSFQSPETSAEGKLIVFNPQASVRVPASASVTGEEK